MQFLAYLKDSFREARSGWVLQAMLVLAALLVLFVASISFRPVSLQEELDAGFRFSTRLMRSNPQFAGTQFLIENYSATNEAEPWKSDYAFDYVVKAPTPEAMKSLKDIRDLPMSRARVEREFRRDLSVLDNLTVATGPETPTEVRFHVTSRGTKAADVTAWRHVPRFLFAFDAPLLTTSLRGGVYVMENYLIGGAGAWVVLFISVVISAGFIPNLLQKGAVDLAVSKPITRTLLLVYKYVGGLTFTAILTAVTVGGAYLVIGLRTGLWNHNFLLAIPIMLFYFAALYAVSVLTAVLTRSTILAILATLLAWGLFFVIGKTNNRVERRLQDEAALTDGGKPDIKPPKPGEMPDPDEILSKLDPDSPLWGFIPKSTFPVIRAVHFVTPRTYQLDARLDRLIAEGILTPNELETNGYGKPPIENWPEMIGVTLGFIVVVLGLACWRFSTRDN